jgi:Ca2+/Na+ antiporter
MKNLFIYYLTILTPLGILIWLSKADLVNPVLFVLLLFFYVLIFRTYVDGKRLSDKNIIQKKDIWKMIIPGKRIEYFKELYLKK